MNYEQLYEQAQQLIARGNHNDAYKILKKLDAAVPNHPGILYLTGICQSKNGGKASAIATYRKVLGLMPNFVEAMNNLGLDLVANNQLEEAILLFDRALRLQPGFDECALNKAGALTTIGKFDAAITILKQLLEKQPKNVDVLVNIGRAFSKAEKDEGALDFFIRALTLQPNDPGIKGHFVTSFAKLRRWKEAIKAYEEIPHDVPEKESHAQDWINAKLKINDFSVYDLDPSYIEKNTYPLTYLYCCETLRSQAKNAQNFSSRFTKGYEHPKKLTGDKIRVGYVSSDFRDHPVAYLTAGVFESHDMSKFDIFGIALDLEENPASPYRTRIQQNCQQFISVYGLSTTEAVDRVRALNLDVAIDLNGHTAGARTEIFAARVAPLQISYLGFPGSMGATFIDYLIGDSIVTPNHLADQYSEKILVLPECFQANDTERCIAPQLDKEAYGLPGNSLVLGCFNQPSKIIPKVLKAWCSVLNRMPFACLWLLQESDEQVANLIDAVRACGVSPEKIFFAEKLPYPEHLARYKVIDLALDTFPFNGGTTTSDALWAGAPVLTLCGETYSSRMAASLLHSVGLSDLITYTLADYESQLLALVSNPTELDRIRKQLAENVSHAPVFDTPRFTRHLEKGLQMVTKRQRAGLKAEHIWVPPIS